MLPTLGPLELAIILVIVVLVFGAGKLPELGSALGKTLREFKSATREISEVQADVKSAVSLEPSAKEPSAKKDGAAKSELAEKKVAS